jgi:hypothetical protein
MPVAWCLADPKIGEREIAQNLAGHARDTGALRDGMIVLCDKGLARREMERYAADQAKVLLARPDRKDEPRRYGNPGEMRQWIESVNDTSRAGLGGDLAGGGQQGQERADPVAVLGGVPEGAVRVDGVPGAPAGPGAGDVPGCLQVGHDGLDGALGDAGPGAEVPDPGSGVAGDLHQDVPVPGQQRPVAAPVVRNTHILGS